VTKSDFKPPISRITGAQTVAPHVEPLTHDQRRAHDRWWAIATFVSGAVIGGAAVAVLLLVVLGVR
jgi:hypothetical protein